MLYCSEENFILLVSNKNCFNQLELSFFIVLHLVHKLESQNVTELCNLGRIVMNAFVIRKPQRNVAFFSADLLVSIS